MLNAVRVLELSQPQTMLAGQILADLGADVIAVEPPGGAPGRRMPPFLDDCIGLERSLVWHAMNRNKRAITLDLDSPDGRATLRRLAESADILIETAPSRFEALADAGLAHCCVRPFSADGPKSRHAFTDRTVIAASGVAAYTGNRDRAPLFIPVPQAMMEAGAEAAIAALAALCARDRDGVGQRAGVSMRAAAMMSALSLPYFSIANDTAPTRGVARKPIAGVEIPSFYACRDGFVLLSITFGAFGAMTRRMAAWVVASGHAPPDITDLDWSAFPASAGDDAQAARLLRALIDGLTALAGESTKDLIGRAAREHQFFAAPLLDMAEVASFEQYAARGLWATQPLPEGRQVQAPVRFARFSDYSIELRRPAPPLSGHTQEVLAEAGYSGTEIQALFAHGIV